MAWSDSVLILRDNDTIYAPRLYHMRKPGIEPGTMAWEATMIAVSPFAPRGEEQVFSDCLTIHLYLQG